MAGVSQGAGCADGAALPSAGPLLPAAGCQPELPALRAPLPPSSSPRRVAAFSQLPLLHFPPPAPVAMTRRAGRNSCPSGCPPLRCPRSPPALPWRARKQKGSGLPTRGVSSPGCASPSPEDASRSRRAAPSRRWLTGRRLCWAGLPLPVKASPGGSGMAFGLASCGAVPCCAGPRCHRVRTLVVVPSCGARAQSPAPPRSTGWAPRSSAALSTAWA